MTASIDATFFALSDPTRRAVIGILSKGPQRPSEMADALTVSRPAISRHLKVLREAGLVVERVQEADTRVREYTLRRKPFGDLRRWLDEVECFWGDQLDAFKAHAERSRKGGAR
ncbi:MAG: winged helix-turn-helix transcriptional regulator [Polyangiaceae bacterium]|nr:winged helix-turn-helix transcriptional regulator [Polyangiaceae bacterium]